MYTRYEQYGLQIVGFPCNQFLRQEPGTNAQIKKTAEEKFKVKFPLMDKIKVNGPETHPVFQYLRSNTKELRSRKDPAKYNELPWNFCRWVVDKQGKIQMYLDPTKPLPLCYEMVEFLLDVEG